MDIFFDDKLDTVKLFKFLYRKRFILLVAIALAIITSIISTRSAKSTYVATGVVFSTLSNSAEYLVQNPQFGFEAHTDHLIQVLLSNSVSDTVIYRLKLWKYYKLDRSNPLWLAKARSRLAANVSIKRSRYLSTSISATMREQALAIAVVNTIIAAGNEERDRLFKDNMRIAITALEKNYTEKEARVGALADRIDSLIASGKVNRRSIKMEHMIRNYQSEQHVLNLAREKYQEALSRYTQPIAKMYAIDSATAAKELRPSLKKNILVSVVSILIFVLVLLWAFEAIKGLRQAMKTS